jgi:hypothetical protein
MQPTVMEPQGHLTPMKTATELAEAVRVEEMEFDDALLELLLQSHPELDLAIFIMVKIAIGYAAMGNFEKQIELSESENLTVRGIINRFGLEPFLEGDAT